MTLAPSGSDLSRLLEAQTKGKVCRVSGKMPVIIWWQDSYVATCIDHNPRPCMWRKTKPVEERMWHMTERALANRPEQTALTVAEIQKFICPTATPVEAEVFIRFCVGNGLNPLINDAYLIKYQAGAKAAIVIGIQALLKRAAENPNYKGYQGGVVILRNGNPVELEGSLTLKGDELVGAWCRISRTDWAQPLKVTVALTEYNKRQAQWNERPATMIEKVALAQALRRAFPGEIGRIYDSARVLNIDVETGDAEDMQQPSQAMRPESAQQPSETTVQPAQPVQVASAPSPSTTSLDDVRKAISEGFAVLGLATNAAQTPWIQTHCMVPDSRRDWKPEHYQAVADALAVAITAHVEEEEANEPM